MYEKINKFRIVELLFCITLLILCCNGCISNTSGNEQPVDLIEPIQDMQKQSNAPEDVNDAYTQKIAALKKELKTTSETMENHRKTLDGFAQSYGSLDLSFEKNLMAEHVKALLNKLTEIEIERIKLEAKVQVLQSKSDKTNEQEQKLADLKLELEIVKTYELRVTNLITKKDNELVDIGRRQIMINEYKNRLEKDKEKYDRVLLSIQKMESARQDSSM